MNTTFWLYFAQFLGFELIVFGVVLAAYQAGRRERLP